MITILGPAQDDMTRPHILFDNAFARGVLAASSTAAGSFADNIKGPQTYDYWQAAAMPATLTLTLAAPEVASMFALAAHDMGSKGAALTLAYSPDLTAPFVDLAAIAPADNDPLAVIFAPVTARRWRLTFSGAQAPALGVAMLGARFVVPAMVAAPFVPMRHAKRVELLAGNSLGGQFFAQRIKRGGGDAQIDFNPAPRAWAESALPAFARAYDAGDAFFFAASPVNAPDDLAYARRAERAGELRPEWLSGGMWTRLRLEVETYGA